MHCRGFQNPLLSKPVFGLYSDVFLEPGSKILLDIVCGDID